MRFVWIPSLFVMLLANDALAVDDLNFWTEAGVRYRVSRQFRLKFDQHVRFSDGVTEIMPEVALSYRPFRSLRLEGGYRFIAESFDQVDDVQLWHRLYADVRLRLRLRPFLLQYRLRFQDAFGWISPDKELKAKQAIRNKLSAEVRLGAGFEPFISAELFNRLDDDKRAWFKLRLTAGTGLDLDSHLLTLSYRMEIYLFDDNLGATTRI